jgi:protein-L-isoaspartate(D-aspartate) O-methyltransferase
MVLTQLRARGIGDERVLAAMERVPRELFVPPDVRAEAYEDAALPIGFEQTISQPYMVARICLELRLQGDERVLDVGTGSGYQAAVLAELAREVHSIELIPELAERAQRNLDGAGYGGRVRIHVGDGSRGLPGLAPFDAIAVAAATREPPPALLDELGRGGRLVIPIGTPQRQVLRVFVATPEGAADYAAVPCRFVPLVSKT